MSLFIFLLTSNDMMMMMMCYLAKDPSSSCSGSLSSCGYAWLIVGQSLYVWKYDAEVLSLLESLYLNMCVICIWQSILVVRCLGSFFFRRIMQVHQQCLICHHLDFPTMHKLFVYTKDKVSFHLCSNIV